MDETSISFEDFESAFGDDDGNQTEIETADEAEVETSVPEEKPEQEEASGDDSADDDKEDAPETEQKPEDTAATETFTLKVNKEEKTYTREEVISLAQKGADYDRVKEQLTNSRNAESDLQKQLDDQKEAMEILADMAKESGMEMPKLLEALRINMMKKQGLSDDAANERLLRMKAEKENAALKANAEKQQSKETASDRAAREIAEFRNAYPDVEINKELIEKLMEDVQGGRSFTDAYRKYERAQTAAKIAELERKLAAQKQNAENRSASPGSQNDSGGRRTKSEYDDFMEAFN